MIHSPVQRGFTLIELLVVIGITAMLLMIAVPSMTNLVDSAKGATAVNSISSAVSSARTKAPFSGPFQTGEYVGAAIIFTPAGEMRIVRHADGTMLANQTGVTGSLDPERAAYKDSGSYLKLPEGIGAVGIVRGSGGGTISNGTGDGVYYVPPPFAIRFNPKGMLVGRSANMSEKIGIVHYDGNFDNFYNTATLKRGSGGTTYNPEAFDPDSSVYNSANKSSVDTNGDGVVDGDDQARHLLPLEMIESCVGILIYNKGDFWAEFNDGLDDNGKREKSDGSAKGRWLTTNGDVLYFNRYTGAVLDQ